MTEFVKLITHKLRQHSIDEEEQMHKPLWTEDKDSGTESDEDNAELVALEQEAEARRKRKFHDDDDDAAAESPKRWLPSSPSSGARFATTWPSERVALGLASTGGSGGEAPMGPSPSEGCVPGETCSDETPEEARDPMMPGPLRFSCSPPKNAARTRRTLSPRLFLARCSSSAAPYDIQPRRDRPRPGRHSTGSIANELRVALLPRPALDFEKMQLRLLGQL